MFYLPIITLVDLCLGEKVGSRVGVSAAGPHRSSAGFGGRGVSLDMSNTGNFSSRVHNWLFLGGEWKIDYTGRPATVNHLRTVVNINQTLRKP